MDNYTSIITDEKFSVLSLNVTTYPKTLYHWETLLNFLISKTSPINKTLDPRLYQLITSTYDNLLFNFPFLENYHIDYALFEYKLSHIKKMYKIFQNALQIFNNRSLLIWIQYLKICNDLISDNKILFSKYDLAETFIGCHYFSSEFWNMYLEQLKLRCNDQNKRYIIILRKLIELPIYNFSKYFALWLKEIDSITDLKQLIKFVSREDLKSKLKIDINYTGRKGPYLQDAKKSLKKFTKELYIVVQYQTLEIYSLFESNLKIHYYTSSDQLIDSNEINTWIKYLDFTINLNIDSLTYLNFQRALTSVTHYDIIWLKFANWMIDYKENFHVAKDILLESLKYSLKKTNILHLLYSLLIKLDELDTLNDILKQIEISFDDQIETCDDFDIFWDYIQFNLFLHNSQPQSRYSSADKNHSESSQSMLPTGLLNKIKTRLDNGKSKNGSEIILSSFLQLQTKENTNEIEEEIFLYLINDSNARDYYRSNNEFWKIYCHLIFFDPARSYLEKRNKIVNEIWGQITAEDKEKKKLIFESLLDFCESYLPEDINSLHETLDI